MEEACISIAQETAITYDRAQQNKANEAQWKSSANTVCVFPPETTSAGLATGYLIGNEAIISTRRGLPLAAEDKNWIYKLITAIAWHTSYRLPGAMYKQDRALEYYR